MHVRFSIFCPGFAFTFYNNLCSGLKFSQLEMSALHLLATQNCERVLIRLSFCSEVILCLLLERFKFSLLDKDIKWSMGSISSPSVEGNKHELPLKVEIAA